jgi:hypothetical protein
MHGALALEAHAQVLHLDDRSVMQHEAPSVKIRRALERDAERRDGLVVEGPTDQLQPDRHAVLAEARRAHQRRATRDS